MNLEHCYPNWTHSASSFWEVNEIEHLDMKG